ncbi:MAG: DUF4012 domain-containing protein [Oscillochloridaceae bacterium umkhey_bin13]
MIHKRSYHHIILALIAVLAALIATGLWAQTTYQHGMALANSLATLERSLQTRDPRRLSEICLQVNDVRLEATNMRSQLGPVLPITQQMAWASADLAAAEPLLNVADDLSLAGQLLCSETERLLAPLPTGQSAPEVGVSRLVAAQPGLELAQSKLVQAGQRLDQLPVDELHPEVQRRMLRIEALLPEVIAQLELLRSLPQLLGADDPRRYLLVAQNPDELRATGGFISAASLLQLEDGRLGPISFRDSPLIDQLAGNSYPFAPEPMRRYMVNPPMSPALWVFRDANWSPDLPTAGNVMLNLYQLGQGERPDGVIVFTPGAIELILRVLGPLRVTGQSVPVGADNLEAYIRLVWSEASASGRGDQRKESLNRLGEAILDRLSGGGDLDVIALTRALGEALDRGELAIYLPNHTATTILAERGWDGGLRPGNADFIHTASANIGYNKVGPNISQQISYALDLSDLSNPQATLTVTHRNRSPGIQECEPLDRDAADRHSYERLMEDCYWNYLRVYVPGTASLLDASIPRVPDHWMLTGDGDQGRLYREAGEGGTQVYSALTVVPRNSEVSLRFRYALPSSVLQVDQDEWRYQLRLTRQPGTNQRATFQVLLPEGATLVSSSHPIQTLGGTIYQLDLAMSQDSTIEIRFRPRQAP